MSARTRKKILYVAAESTYATDPSANGSGYSWVPAVELGELTDGKQILDANYFTGRNFPSRHEVGADGWSFTCTVPLIGLSSAAGDGTNASSVSDDWLDILLQHIFGARSNTSGEGVGSASTTSNLVLDTDTYSAGDTLLVYESGIPSAGPRAQPTYVTVDPATGQYTVAPVFSTAPTTAAVAYGGHHFDFDDDGGSSLAFVYQDSDVGTYTCLGGRVTDATIVGDVGQMCKLSITVSGDRKSEDASGKSSLPAVGNGPAVTPVKALLSPVWFGGTQYETRKFELPFGLVATPIDSTAATNGRSGFDNVFQEPMANIEPLRTNAITDLKRNRTLGTFMLQMGSGVLSGGAINCVVIYAAQAAVKEAAPSDDGGRGRTSVSLAISDAGTGTTFFRLSRF